MSPDTVSGQVSESGRTVRRTPGQDTPSVGGVRVRRPAGSGEKLSGPVPLLLDCPGCGGTVWRPAGARLCFACTAARRGPATIGLVALDAPALLEELGRRGVTLSLAPNGDLRLFPKVDSREMPAAVLWAVSARQDELRELLGQRADG